MEHELRIDAEVVCEAEARGVLLAVVRELLAQSDEHAIEPAQYIWRIVDLRLKHGDSCHQDSSRLLIERGGDAGRACFCKVTSNSSDSQSLLTRRMLVVRDELDQASRAWLQWLACWSDHFEVDCFRCPRVDDVDFPCRSPTDANLRFTDTGGFLASGNRMADHTRNLQLLGGL